MLIAGIAKSSVIDYPNNICTVLFTGGCNLKCSYCHNPELIDFKGPPLDETEVCNFLLKRRKFIDAVCISGGEPCLQSGLLEFLKFLKANNFKVKLDTNGTRPDVLESLIESRMLDYVAMDVKAPLEKYHSATGTFVDIKTIKRSIQLLLSFQGDCEFRTTVCKPILTKEDIIDIAYLLKGAKRYYLQQYRPTTKMKATTNSLLPYSKEEIEGIKKEIEGYFQICSVRG